jgi:hypothetical protein
MRAASTGGQRSGTGANVCSRIRTDVWTEPTLCPGTRSRTVTRVLVRHRCGGRGACTGTWHQTSGRERGDLAGEPAPVDVGAACLKLIDHFHMRLQHAFEDVLAIPRYRRRDTLREVVIEPRAEPSDRMVR